MLTREKEIISETPLFDIIKELSLFEQTDYCINYIKNSIVGIDDTKAIEQGEIAGACFRQAKEYYGAGQKVSLSTRPLLYSYSLNNYTKGMAHLTTTDSDILKGFKRHGFDNNFNSSFLESDVIKKANGTVASLEKMVQDKEIEVDKKIPLHMLLALIPNLNKTFNATTKYVSYIPIPLKSDNDFKLITQGKSFELNEKQYKLIGLMGQKVAQHPHWGDEGIVMAINVRGQEVIKNLKGLPYLSNRHIFLPLLIDNEAVLVQPMVASYLVIMTYGMLVRYHAEKWDKIIDPKTSGEYSLVKISVEECYNEFVTNLYRYIFKQRIVTKQFNDDNIKEYLTNNKKEILDMLEKEKKRLNGTNVC